MNKNGELIWVPAVTNGNKMFFVTAVVSRKFMFTGKRIDRIDEFSRVFVNWVGQDKRELFAGLIVFIYVLSSKSSFRNGNA